MQTHKTHMKLAQGILSGGAIQNQCGLLNSSAYSAVADLPSCVWELCSTKPLCHRAGQSSHCNILSLLKQPSRTSCSTKYRPSLWWTSLWWLELVSRSIMYSRYTGQKNRRYLLQTQRVYPWGNLEGSHGLGHIGTSLPWWTNAALIVPTGS